MSGVTLGQERRAGAADDPVARAATLAAAKREGCMGLEAAWLAPTAGIVQKPSRKPRPEIKAVLDLPAKG